MWRCCETTFYLVMLFGRVNEKSFALQNTCHNILVADLRLTFFASLCFVVIILGVP